MDRVDTSTESLMFIDHILMTNNQMKYHRIILSPGVMFFD